MFETDNFDSSNLICTLALVWDSSDFVKYTFDPVLKISSSLLPNSLRTEVLSPNNLYSIDAKTGGPESNLLIIILISGLFITIDFANFGKFFFIDW